MIESYSNNITAVTNLIEQTKKRKEKLYQII